MGTGKQYDEEFKKQAIMLAKEIGNAAAAKRKARYSLLDFLGNFRSTVLLVSSAPGFVSLPIKLRSRKMIYFTLNNFLTIQQTVIIRIRSIRVVDFPPSANLLLCFIIFPCIYYTIFYPKTLLFIRISRLLQRKSKH